MRIQKIATCDCPVKIWNYLRGGDRIFRKCNRRLRLAGIIKYRTIIKSAYAYQLSDAFRKTMETEKALIINQHTIRTQLAVYTK
jgi:hypothetical protein